MISNTSDRIAVGVVGATGYVGKKLVSICQSHPHIENLRLYGAHSSGQSLWEVAPEMEARSDDLPVRSIEQLDPSLDAYFVALPHGESMRVIPMLLDQGGVVIDLGGDFRLQNPDDYKTWYHTDHTAPELLPAALYGLADFGDWNYDTVQLIANPGCYATAVLLSLLPLAERHAGDILAVSAIGYSGTSGAGKSARADLMMAEMHGNVRAYDVQTHRHEAEILQTMSIFGFHAPFHFVAHLLPIDTGLYTTCAVHMKNPLPSRTIHDLYANAYDGKTFVRLRSQPPHLRWVVGTNFCDIHVSIRDRSVIVTAAIDNLVKGASGQAAQNLNKRFGWDESTAILENRSVSIY